MIICDGTRLEIKLQEPNKLFLSWLQRWLEDAEARNTKSQNKLREAIQALREYPLPLYSGRECAILRGFGIKLCNLIDEELRRLHSDEQLHEITRNNNTYQREVQQVVESVKQTALSKETKGKVSVKPKKISKKVQKALEEEEERQREVVMNAGTFRIFLIVDTQETKGKNKRIHDQTRSYLESLTVPHEIRRLTVGDFLWIARDEAQNELVLPYIVERKRMDDLASSIRDGRFHEQKHRLQQSGIQHVVYLIEDYGDNEQLGLPFETLQQAMVNTQIHSGFTIARTENHFRSMVYLQGITRILTQLYKDKLLIATSKEQLQPIRPHDTVVRLLKFRTLYENSSRSTQLTVREVFVQQLLQLHSLSLEKALALVERYPTPRLLLDAYDACANEMEARKLLANITSGQLRRPIGQKISQCIYEFYRTQFS